MALIRYEANPLATLIDDLESLWAGNFDKAGRDYKGNLFPNVDIIEEESGYKIKADLPGLSREEIKINVEDGVLSISGEKKHELENRNKNRYYHLERSYGSFKRSFSLPSHVDNSAIEAHYTNGVLEIVLKKTEESKPKTIEVKVL